MYSPCCVSVIFSRLNSDVSDTMLLLKYHVYVADGLLSTLQVNVRLSPTKTESNDLLNFIVCASISKGKKQRKALQNWWDKL